ncbi:MAG: alpha/beta fold hydrolase, partial [Verrucomicrobiaceae bacterium]
DLWQAAILLAPHPGLKDPAERSARLRHDQAWADRTRRTPWPELLTDWNAQPVLAGGPAPSAAEEWRPEIAGAFEDWSLGHQSGDLSASLADHPVPVLWITGEQDVKFTALGAAAARVVPLIRHHILPDCGHRLLQQDSQAVRALVSGFLQSLSSASSLS